MTNVMNLQDFRTRADVFPVGGVQEKFIDMTTKYNQGNYGDAVAMAKTLVESTCAHVYHTVTNKEIEEDKGRVQVTGNYTIGMYTAVRETLNLFAAQLPNFEQTERIATTTCDLVQSITNLRNSAAATHGGRKRSIPPAKLEALLAIEVSENLAASLLLMVHMYKYPDDSNVIGSFIDKTDDMESYVDVNDSGRYVVDSPQFSIGYTVIQSVIQRVDYEVKKLPRQECQWSGQKLSGSAECVWLSLKFTHYQIFYQRLILFNVQEGLQTSPGIWCFPQGCAPIERLLIQLLTFFCKHRDRWSRDHDCRRCCNEQWIQ